MNAKRYSPAPRSFEWSDTIPEGISRIIRTPTPLAHKPRPRLQQISMNFESAMPLPAVSELDQTTGWDEFEAASRQDTLW